MDVVIFSKALYKKIEQREQDISTLLISGGVQNSRAVSPISRRGTRTLFC